MIYRFNVTMTDNDYYEFNQFWLTRSPYGKNQMMTIRLLFAVCCLLLFIGSLSSSGYTLTALIVNLFLLVVYAVLILCSKRIILLFYKAQIKHIVKTGKKLYSPSSILEFYEDSFAEITPDKRVEQKYTTVERISIVNEKVIYIHENKLMTYVLPYNSFESKEQYNNFLSFITARCSNVDFYLSI